MNIALKKFHEKPLTASQFRSNEQCVKNLIFKDQAYLFPRGIPGSAPYWQVYVRSNSDGATTWNPILVFDFSMR